MLSKFLSCLNQVVLLTKQTIYKSRLFIDLAYFETIFYLHYFNERKVQRLRFIDIVDLHIELKSSSIKFVHVYLTKTDCLNTVTRSNDI